MIRFMLKVMVSNGPAQLGRAGDFSWVPEGELVARYGVVCDDERPDGGGCGCGRSFSGLTTFKGTTTAVLVARDVTAAEWIACVESAMREAGWLRGISGSDVSDLLDWITDRDLHALQGLPVGTLLGRRAWKQPDGDTFDEIVVRR